MEVPSRAVNPSVSMLKGVPSRVVNPSVNMQMEVPSRVVNPSVLKEWEEMHRPPPLDQPILPSGPVRGRRVVGMMNRQSNMLNKNRRMTCEEQVRRHCRRWQGRREGVTAISIIYAHSYY